MRLPFLFLFISLALSLPDSSPDHLDPVSSNHLNSDTLDNPETLDIQNAHPPSQQDFVGIQIDADVDISLNSPFPFVQQNLYISSSSPLSSFDILFPHNAIISGLSILDYKSSSPLSFFKAITNEYLNVSIAFPEPIASTTVFISYYHHNTLTFSPPTVTQDVLAEADYSSFLCPLSAHTTKSCNVRLHHAHQAQILSSSLPYSSSGDATVFSLETPLAPFETTPVVVHFNPHPRLRIPTLRRSVDLPTLSSTVVIQDHYDPIVNEGPQTTGGFNRAEFQNKPYEFPNTFGFFETAFPADAFDFQYFDSTGNISTSVVNRHDENITLFLLPRFPLISGWKTEFTVGFSLRSADVIEPGKVRLPVPKMNNAFCDSLELAVDLPDGSRFKSIQTTLDVQSVQVTDVPSPMAFGDRQRVQVVLRNVNLMVKTDDIVLLVDESFAATSRTFVAVGLYALLAAGALVLFILFA